MISGFFTMQFCIFLFFVINKSSILILPKYLPSFDSKYPSVLLFFLAQVLQLGNKLINSNGGLTLTELMPLLQLSQATQLSGFGSILDSIM